MNNTLQRMNLLIILLPMADYDDQLLPVHPGGGGEPRSHLAGDWPHLSGLSPRFGYHEHEGVRLEGRECDGLITLQKLNGEVVDVWIQSGMGAREGE